MDGWTHDKTAASSRFLDRFDLVLVLVLATICVQALVDVRGSALGGLATHAISGLALVVAVRAADAPLRWRRSATGLVLGTLFANACYVLLAFFADHDPGRAGGELLWVVAAGMVPVVVAQRLVRHPRVTVQTVMGAVAAYLQIAVAFAGLFQFIDVITKTPFFETQVSTTLYTYASLQTITTLGYGDLTPSSDLGRLVVVSEAVIGQVFLVTFVALIVSRFAAHPPAGADD